MNDDILLKITTRRDEIVNLLSIEEKKMREYSQQVSQAQVMILELRAELKALEKILNQIK
jgi:hypothetical protein